MCSPIECGTYAGVEWRLRKHLERKASLMEGTSGAEGAGGGKGRWGRLLAKILDNVQVTVHHTTTLCVPVVRIGHECASSLTYEVIICSYSKHGS